MIRSWLIVSHSTLPIWLMVSTVRVGVDVCRSSIEQFGLGGQTAIEWCRATVVEVARWLGDRFCPWCFNEDWWDLTLKPDLPLNDAECIANWLRPAVVVVVVPAAAAALVVGNQDVTEEARLERRPSTSLIDRLEFIKLDGDLRWRPPLDVQQQNKILPIVPNSSQISLIYSGKRIKSGKHNAGNYKLINRKK